MYPINLDLNGQSCLVLGGGAVAERKVCRLLAEGAAVTVIAPSLTRPLQELAESHHLTWQPRTYQAGDESTFFLIICATSPCRPSSARATSSSPFPPTARHRRCRAGSGSNWNSTSTNAMAAGSLN